MSAANRKYGICPCYGCTERKSDCHAVCDRYEEWNEKHIQKREESQRRIFLENQAVYRRKEFFQQNKKYRRKER